MLRYNITFDLSREVNPHDVTDMPRHRLAPGWPRRRLFWSLLVATVLHLGIFAAMSAFVHRPEVPLAVSEPAIAMVMMSAPQPDAPPQSQTADAIEPPLDAPEPPAPPEPPPAPPPVAPSPEAVAQPPPPPAPEPLPPAPDIRTAPAELPPTPKPVKRSRPNPPGRAADGPSSPKPAAPSITPAPPAAEAPVAMDWQRALAAWLAEHKTYPEIARRQGAQGGVLLRFTADRSGHVLDVELVRSAGSAILDHAAEAMLRDATIPPFSATMAQDRITVTVQIRYALTN